MKFDASLAARRFDVIVVGSGAAGSTMAAKLAAKGKSVLIVEAGPERGKDQLISSAIWARRLKWNGAQVLETGSNPVGHSFNSGFGLGGSALHHYAVWPRFHAEDFDVAERYGVGLDWPIDYDDLRPYYDEVQAEVGISGDANAEVWRPEGAAYPMPPVPLFDQGRIIARGFEKLGKTVAPLPLAITSEAFNGRPPCTWDGWCDAGCPIGALANPLTVYLPLASAAKAEIVTDTPVTRILTDHNGDRVNGVAVRPENGPEFELHADVVILAAFAVQNPRLMLASTSDAHPHGIGNNSGQVGKFIMTHSAALVYGLFDEATSHYQGAFGGQLVNQDCYPKESHKKDGGFGSYQWMIAQAVKPNDLLGIATTRADLFGNDLHTFMQRAARGFASMTGVVEGLPVAENAVTLTDQLDSLGVPVANVHHTHHEQSTALWKAAVADGKAVFEAAGAKETWTGPQAAMHIMGGTIMGRRPEDSVTNSYGQVHEVPNLIVAGPGLFPTSAGVNPTFTVTALAARSAEHIAENWRSISGS